MTTVSFLNDFKTHFKLCLSPYSAAALFITLYSRQSMFEQLMRNSEVKRYIGWAVNLVYYNSNFMNVYLKLILSSSWFKVRNTFFSLCQSMFEPLMHNSEVKRYIGWAVNMVYYSFNILNVYLKLMLSFSWFKVKNYFVH